MSSEKVLSFLQWRYEITQSLVLSDHVLQLDRRRSASLSLTRGLLRVRTYSEEALAEKFFQIPLKGSTLGDLVSFTVVVRTVIFRSRKRGIYWIDFGHLTHGWSLMAMKNSLMESHNGAKCFFTLKAQSGFREN